MCTVRVTVVVLKWIHLRAEGLQGSKRCTDCYEINGEKVNMGIMLCMCIIFDIFKLNLLNYFKHFYFIILWMVLTIKNVLKIVV